MSRTCSYCSQNTGLSTYCQACSFTINDCEKKAEREDLYWSAGLLGSIKQTFDAFQVCLTYDAHFDDYSVVLLEISR